RIDDEEPTGALPRDDGPELGAPAVAIVRRREIRELEVDAQTPVRVERRRGDELGPELDPAPAHDAIVGSHGTLKIGSDLPERQEAERRLHRGVELAVERSLRWGRVAVAGRPVVQMKLDAGRAGRVRRAV